MSITTVSRALGGYPDVSAETRRRVIDEAERIGYRPNALGRRLRTGRADAVGVVLPSPAGRFADPFMAQLLAVIGDRLRHEGLDLVVSACPPGEQEIPTYRRLVEPRVVDAAILTRTRRDDVRVRYLLDQGTPFVAFGGSEGISEPFSQVDVDGHAAVHEACDLLIGLGHRRIAFIGGPTALNYSAHREMGWRDAMDAAGLRVEPSWLVPGDLTEEGGAAAAGRLLDDGLRPTAILCINDATAIGAMFACRERGLIIGHDVSLVGFDDIPFARFSAPGLTTIRQPTAEIGEELVALLLRRLRQPDEPPVTRVLSARLVPRGSHGPPP